MIYYMRYIILAIIGLISGITGGIFGTSTAYALFFGLMLTGAIGDYKETIATVMFTILPPLSFMAVYEYNKQKLIDFKAGLFLMPILAFGSYLGAKMQRKLTIPQGEASMGVFLILIAANLFYKAYHGGE